MSTSKHYDVFVSYSEMVGEHHAEKVRDALEMENYKPFVAHLDRIHVSGDFRHVTDRIIENARIFVLILNYNTLTRQEVIREVKMAKKFHKDSGENTFWIFREDLVDIPRTSEQIEQETGIKLGGMSQVDFKHDNELCTQILRKCNYIAKNIQTPPPSTPTMESERNFIQRFAARYTENGYRAVLERNIGGGHLADLTLHTENEMILCEFKTAATLCSVSTLRQLLAYRSQLRGIMPETKIRLMLITARGFFNADFRECAGDYGVELCDENDLDNSNILIFMDRSAYALNDTIHLQVSIFTTSRKAPVALQFVDCMGRVIFECSKPANQEKDLQEFVLLLNECDWNVNEKYTVRASHNQQEAKSEFLIQEPGPVV